MRRRAFLGTIGCIPALALSAPTGSANPGAGRKPAKAKAAIPGQRVGIAFGGGSIHGIAHVGVLKAFAEKGLPFHFIAGTSVGAIVGVLVAAKLPYAEIDAIARRIEWPGLLSLSWSGKGLMQNAKLRTMIDTALSDRRIEQLSLPFGAVATDVATGERVVIRKGSAGAAVDASCSIPVFFEPVKIDGRALVDGGLTEPVPVIAVREMGANIVIGVDVAFRPGEDQFHGLTGVAFQTMHIMANALINEQIPRADVAIRMNLHQFIGKDNSHDQLIAAGYAAAMRAWPKIASMMS
ncbi:MAG: patatin-like phospholipase family protein [Betaproteobacteria bacterium]|nr:patatin-like phospholipase family protein [Betaproteobacteria bacterium]